MGKTMARSGWIVGIGAALTLAIAPLATAAGVGNTVNGCQAQYFNTAFSLNCRSVKATGTYQSKGHCDSQADRFGPTAYLTKGTTRNGVSSGECKYKVSGATAYYLG